MKPNVFFFVLLFASLTANAQFDFDAYALHHLNVVDVNTKEIRNDHTIVVINGVITKIIPSTSYVSNDSIQSIFLRNKYVVPGLIDSHVHFATNPTLERRDAAEETLKAMLLTGITAVRDMAGDTRALSGLSRNALVGDIDAPNIYYASLMAGTEFFSDPRTVATAQGGVSGKMPYMKAIDSTSNIVLEVAEAKGTGASGIKLYANLSKEEIYAIVVEAKKQQVPVWAHAALNPVKPSEIITSGVISISHVHMLVDEFSATNKDLINRWEAHKISKNDALFWDNEFQSLALKKLYELMIQHKVVLDATLSVLETYKDQSKSSWKYELGIRITKAAHKHGVMVAAGSDTDQETFVQHEMNLLVNSCEFTPVEALIAATKNGALATGVFATEGSIESGKKANLLVLNSDPTENIKNIENVFMVIKNGKMYNPE